MSITQQYKEVRTEELVNEFLDEYEEGFINEAMQNITMWPRYKEMFEAFRKVDADEYYTLWYDYFKWFATWTADIVATREIEELPEYKLAMYLNGEVEEEWTDTIRIVRVS